MFFLKFMGWILVFPRSCFLITSCTDILYGIFPLSLLWHVSYSAWGFTISLTGRLSP